MDLNGISLRASYKPQPGELFFSRLLRFNETTQSCSIHAYIPMNHNYSTFGLSLHTECPLLALDELIFSDMSHTLTFIGSREPMCLTSDFLNVITPALVIESELKIDYLRLGNILELEPNLNGPDIITVFGKDENSNFVSHLHTVQVTLFGTMFSKKAVIKNNWLEIIATTKVFGYPANITITAPSNNANWQELPLTVKGTLLPGDDSFVERLSKVVVDKISILAESGKKREEIAKMALDQSKERFQFINNQLIEAEMIVSLAELRRSDAQLNITALNESLIALESNFSNIDAEFQTLFDSLDNVCTEQYCEDVCRPGEFCRNCTKPTFISKTSKCPVTIQEARTVRIAPFVVRRTTWRFVLVCFLQDNTICQGVDCSQGETDNCYGKCVPVTSLVPVYNWVTVLVDVPTFENCTIQVFNSSVPGTCCENVTCVVLAPDPLCVASNAMCRSARKNATEEADDVRQESRELFLRVLDARKALSLAITIEKRASIDLEIYKRRRDELERSHSRLKDACNTATKVYNRTIDKIQSLLRLYDSGIENIFQVKSVSFNEVLTTNPNSLALIVLYTGNGHECEQTFVYNSLFKEENFERISNEIIDYVFLANCSTRQQARFGRQAASEITQRQIFDSRCAHISNTLQFFIEIQTRLQEIQSNIAKPLEGTPQLSESLINQGLSEDEEFQAYLELVKGLEDLSIEALHALESTIFYEWQASMELLYSESGSVGEISCNGFADCLQTAVDELQRLISLTPENELTEEFISLLSNISTAEKNLLELALYSNITIDEGLARVEPILKIMNAYATDNYWCNEPPVIKTQPPHELNISLGGILQILCVAESNLVVSYEWERNGNVLPQFTTAELIIPSVQRLDSANYTCFASNPVGRLQSITTSVTVYELPEFYLTPESVVTYFGDDNGAWFACNATAWPYPGWRWFYRNDTDQQWTIIDEEETNELLILNPQEENVGMYACEAYNYHGSIRSEAVTLTLLPLTVSQHLFPVEFTIFSANTSCNQEYLYDSLYILMPETIDGETAIIEDFNVTEVDAENFGVSLTLVSQNVTTRYLHLMTLAEIANLALPHATSLRKSVQLIRNLIEGDIGSQICSGNTASVVQDSLVVGKLTYLCPPGQRLNSDYLLCGKL